MKEITSRTNPVVKQITKLHQAKYRDKEQLFIGQGTRVCSTLLASPVKLCQLYVTKELLSAARNLVGDALITLVTDEVMEKISTLSTPPGIVGIFETPSIPENPPLDKGIILYEISDPGNMGTLMRSAAAMNITTVIVCGGADPWNPKVVQASAGTIGLITLLQWPWQTILKQKKNTLLAALTVQGKNHPEELKNKPVLLVVGSEAHGIPKSVIAECDSTVTILMPGNIESLNAAIAGSIALYLVFMP